MIIEIYDMWEDCDHAIMVGDRWSGQVRVMGWAPITREGETIESLTAELARIGADLMRKDLAA